MCYALYVIRIYCLFPVLEFADRVSFYHPGWLSAMLGCLLVSFVCVCVCICPSVCLSNLFLCLDSVGTYVLCMDVRRLGCESVPRHAGRVSWPHPARDPLPLFPAPVVNQHREIIVRRLSAAPYPSAHRVITMPRGSRDHPILSLTTAGTRCCLQAPRMDAS